MNGCYIYTQVQFVRGQYFNDGLYYYSIMKV